VRVLSVGAASFPQHYGGMATDTPATTFVTGAAGFIGSELIKLLVARGHRVFGLAESVEAAERVRRVGAVAVMGDLLTPGPWQDEVAAGWVFHLVPYSVVQLTTHFFSPNPVENSIIIRAAWQDSKDTSIVWGRVVESSVDANFVKAGAIPWLKVETAGTQDGPTGGDTLSKTTFIQRVNTDGGAAPSTDCDRPTDIGRKAFVPYTADYILYKK
jgi:hypothetical protein